ncbi:hypothetical protein C2S53_016153 [Perilla frutescens var. hirtella]|uniref:RWP-RK domain-containing protein n=1 Tax=Perilla frutescens var. hirtella TaxID=608512 RepID=A0AAD4J5J2_PERFH|nr:hypothetical protein C2S53_016153 [Perilla frutescens var. hirtella]
MADSTATFTYFQTTEPLNVPNILNEEHNYLNLDDDHQSPQELDTLFDTEDLFSDPVIWQLCNGNSLQQNGINQDLNGDHSMAVSLFSVPPSQYSCACCQILRQITHTNGISMKRLEIHGAFGIITHALLGIYDNGTQDCQMFDFDKESTQTVKKFLVQYYEVCRQEGYSPMQDPLSTFYEALSVGFNEPDNHFLQQITGDCQSNQRSNQVGLGLMKIPLAMQRERTRNLGLKDFVDYFDRPIEDAARKLNICPTVMKKICRKHGVLRWPYRKIKSIQRKISKSNKILDATAHQHRERLLQDIQNYKQQLANIYAQFTY